jgi:uncharacterized metal-binding protein
MSFSLDVHIGYFCRAIFLSPLVPYAIYVKYSKKSHVVINGNHVRVSNLIEIFLTATLLTRTSAQVLKLWGVNKRSDI